MTDNEHPFELVSSFSPTGDQPQAIDRLVKGVEEGKKWQVLQGATGTGKTFTMANIIQRLQRTTMVLVHNKTQEENVVVLEEDLHLMVVLLGPT